MDPQTPQHNSRKACNIETNTADRTINTTDSHSDFGVDHPASLAFKRRSNGVEHIQHSAVNVHRTHRTRKQIAVLIKGNGDNASIRGRKCNGTTRCIKTIRKNSDTLETRGQRTTCLLQLSSRRQNGTGRDECLGRGVERC